MEAQAMAEQTHGDMAEQTTESIPSMKLELVPIPVADIDIAKAFYADNVGFNVDLDVSPREGIRIVQLTPPGSSCSIVLGAGLPGIAMQPGSVRGIHLVVTGIEKVREALIARGVIMGEVVDMGGVKYAGFSDPDGNTWTLQEMPWRS
jgi:predicted enzyme related to lactoylglutathione lyase